MFRTLEVQPDFVGHLLMHPNNGRDEEQVECKDQQKSGLKMANFDWHKAQNFDADQGDDKSSDSGEGYFVGQVVDREVKHRLIINR